MLKNPIVMFILGMVAGIMFKDQLAGILGKIPVLGPLLYKPKPGGTE